MKKNENRLILQYNWMHGIRCIFIGITLTNGFSVPFAFYHSYVLHITTIWNSIHSRKCTLVNHHCLSHRLIMDESAVVEALRKALESIKQECERKGAEELYRDQTVRLVQSVSSYIEDQATTICVRVLPMYHSREISLYSICDPSWKKLKRCVPVQISISVT